MELFGRKPAVVWHDSKLGETLSMFRQEKSHMAVVRDVECEGVVSSSAVYSVAAPEVTPHTVL
jgi:CBS domain containing-hemolysin-like protein